MRHGVERAIIRWWVSLALALVFFRGATAEAQEERAALFQAVADKSKPADERFAEAMRLIFSEEDMDDPTSLPPVTRAGEVSIIKNILEDKTDKASIRIVALMLGQRYSLSSAPDSAIFCDTSISRSTDDSEELTVRQFFSMSLGVFCSAEPLKVIQSLERIADPMISAFAIESLSGISFRGKDLSDLPVKERLGVATKAIALLDEPQLHARRKSALLSVIEDLMGGNVGDNPSHQQRRTALQDTLVEKARNLLATPHLAAQAIAAAAKNQLSGSSNEGMLVEWLSRKDTHPDVVIAILRIPEVDASLRQQLAAPVSRIVEDASRTTLARAMAIRMLTRIIISDHKDSLAHEAFELLRSVARESNDDEFLEDAVLGLASSADLTPLPQGERERIIKLLSDRSRPPSLRLAASRAIRTHLSQLSKAELKTCLEVLVDPTLLGERTRSTFAEFLDTQNDRETVGMTFWTLLHSTDEEQHDVQPAIARLVGTRFSENAQQTTEFLKGETRNETVKQLIIGSINPVVVGRSSAHAGALLDAYFTVASTAKSPTLKTAARNAFRALASEIGISNSIELIPLLQGILARLDSDPRPPIDVAHAKQQLETLTNYKIAHPLLALKLWILGRQSIAWGVACYIALTLLVLLVLKYRPLWLLLINDKLNFSIPFKLFGLTEIPIPARHLLVVGFFHYHPRVLGAWTQRFSKTITANLDSLAVVSARSVCLPVPGRDNNNRAMSLTPDLFDLEVGASGRRCLLLMGEGGAGKTTLAVGIAQRALARFGIVPLFITDTGVKEDDGPRKIVELARGALQSISGETDLSPTLVTQMLLKGRLLVILDRLSERPDSTAQTFNPCAPDFPVAKLLVTSRADEYADCPGRKRFKLDRLRGAALTGFVQTYVDQKGYTARFPSTEAHHLCFEIEHLARERGSTPLLATLFVELRVPKALATDSKAGTEPSVPQPTSIPNLFALYVAQVISPAVTAKWAHIDAARGIRVLARRCTYGFHSDKIGVDEAIAALVQACGASLGEGAEALDNAREFLTCCVDELRLLENAGVANAELQFTLDPLAEYMGALRCIEELGEDQAKWDVELRRLQEIIQSPQRTTDVAGYVSALAQSIEADPAALPFVVREQVKQIFSACGPRRAS
ncbi:hypothetical protein [Myxococcus sp. CA040A]|uniref:hypothetical protein n=1 Tax=Myxococcus sp. CA040A TaxID=2741738 RepID=UPI001C2D86AB|nr:hypothetical protein [Myxococcus sp. CA040A]NTX01398.1 hypothetical protein [Myxococcus sp. CA040A]